MSKVIFDVYEHPAGQRLEVSVERALVACRGRHGCEPVAVWVSPSVAVEGVVAGLPLRCGPQMSAWYVYLELPGARQAALPLVAEDVGAQTSADERPLEPATTTTTAAPRAMGAPVQLALL